MRNSIAFGVVAFTFAAAGFAQTTARMALPSEFMAAAERLPASGFGGRNRGRFQLGGFQGDFTRTESRLAFFDPLYTRNRGSASFTLEGPGIEDTIAAECAFKEQVATVGIVTFDPKKLAYICELSRNGVESIGRVRVGEPRPENIKHRLLARSVRIGDAEVESLRITIASVHEYQGSRFGSQTPVGYLLTLESNVVGAIELTDINPTVIVKTDITASARQAVLVCALALAVFRDPADSALAD